MRSVLAPCLHVDTEYNNTSKCELIQQSKNIFMCIGSESIGIIIYTNEAIQETTYNNNIN